MRAPLIRLTALGLYCAAGDLLPDGTVIDGEILPFSEGSVLPFAQHRRWRRDKARAMPTASAGAGPPRRRRLRRPYRQRGEGLSLPAL